MMDVAHFTKELREGQSVQFPKEASSREFAVDLDKKDKLAHLRSQFNIPTKSSLKAKSLNSTAVRKTQFRNDSQQDLTEESKTDDDETSVYFCGNSLGCQPKAVREYLDAHLNTWSAIGVNGHFQDFEESPLVAWQDMAEDVSKKSADIVGALPSEVVIMNTLTVNLHLMLASFFKPTAQRHKIICEWKPFPSDFYAIESHLQWHSLSPAKSMIQLQPPESLILSTEQILAAIDEHADSTALLLLPGIQYYTGQLLDIPLITTYAQARGIVVGWDLAHAAGNVPLKLHDWNVDFAVWCTYKYINAGPGSIAGAFVHERHGKLDEDADGKLSYRHRLTGWYGGDKAVRFLMDNKFRPTVGAGGFQLSNPSVIDLASLSAALSVFKQTDMDSLRNKSVLLTAYAEFMLDDILARNPVKDSEEPYFKILTPRDPSQRGAQLSVLLRDGLLEQVGGAFREAGVVCDQRKPGVIRCAPVPIYNNFEDVWKYMDVLEKAVTS